MVSRISVVTEYEERTRRMQHVSLFSYGRRMLRDDGGPKRFFFNYLFSDQTMGTEFFKNLGLHRSKMLCKNCVQDMTW